MREFDKALEIYMRIDIIQVQTLGPIHPNTLRTQANIGSLLIHVNPAEASRYLNMAYRGRLQSLVPQHRETMHSEFLIAYLDYINGYLEQALGKLQSINKRHLDHLGSEHCDPNVSKQTLDKVAQMIDAQTIEHPSPEFFMSLFPPNQAYSVGRTNNVKTVELISPPMTTVASGL